MFYHAWELNSSVTILFVAGDDDDNSHNSTVPCKDLQKALKRDDLEILAAI